MTTKNANQTTVSTAYVVNPAKGEIKLVMTTSKEKEVKTPVDAQPKYVKTYYSIDTNGGGYAGL
ncbi:hypothetical protein [Flavisolibacter nicotianae]|uniref:hypothetical protein n=1 Tax=Flavisolibacter nicotianae TaxID=2364882 RepID=UPI000EADB78C|nr:hypothetical protein [Flavisolibacter nicotianae]